MDKTHSCSFEGCDKVFQRQFQLKKHMATHEKPDSLSYCSQCTFYTLDPRNLQVHIATHTGEKIHECPDTKNVCGPSGGLTEVRCGYTTNDRSLLTKHRKRVHGYIPRTRTRPQPAMTFAFVPYPAPSSSTITSGSVATSNATSRVGKSRRKRNATAQRPKSSGTRGAGNAQDSTGDAEHTALDSSMPSTSQEGVDEHGQRAHVESPVAVVSSSVGCSGTMSLTLNEYTSLDAHGQQAYVELPDTTGTLAASSNDAVSVVPNEGISLDTYGKSADVESLHAAGSSSTAPSAPDQGMLIDALFGPAPDYDWSKFYEEDFTAPSMAVAQNFTPNLQMDTFVTGGFGMDIAQDGPGIESWNESDWNNLWARFNSD